MKINKGIIKNVNKRLLVGTLALTLLTTGFTGCSGDAVHYFDVVQENELGEKIYTDNIDHSSVVADKVVVFEKNEEYSIFIARNIGGEGYKNYRNIFDGTCVYHQEYSNLNIISEEPLVDYLVMYDRVQDEYTAEEIEEILEQIKADYKKTNNKVLVKE